MSSVLLVAVWKRFDNKKVAYLQGAEASKEKRTASLCGSPSTGASCSVFFFKFTAFLMVEV